MNGGISAAEAPNRVGVFIRSNCQRGSNIIDMDLLQAAMLKRAVHNYNQHCDTAPDKALDYYTQTVKRVADLGLSAMQAPPLVYAATGQGRIRQPDSGIAPTH